MLSIVLTDATVPPALLSAILRPAAARTWDQLTVDGDTSTNDTVFLLASGAAGTAEIRAGSPESEAFAAAVEAVARDLARQQAADGEGATTLLTCQVSGAIDDAEARAVARAIVSSSLVKAAIHGRDPNWGRIAGAAGNAILAEAAVLEAAGLESETARARAGAPATVDPDRLRIAIAGHPVFDGTLGGPQPFDRAAARASMAASEVLVRLDLGLGARHRRSLRLRPDRDVCHRELGIHDVNSVIATPASRWQGAGEHESERTPQVRERSRAAGNAARGRRGGDHRGRG